MGEPSRILRAGFGALIVLMPLTVVASAGAQGGDGSAINDLVGSFLLENGYEFDDPDAIRQQIDDGTEDVAGSTEPYDNFDLGPPAIDAADIEPQAVSIVRVDPAELVASGPVVDQTLRLTEDHDPSVVPLHPEPWSRFATATIIADEQAFGGQQAFVDYAVDRAAPTVDLFGLESDVEATPTIGGLEEQAQAVIADAIANQVPTSPLKLSGWFTGLVFGETGPLGCGQHLDYFVFCDPSDPGGTQFAGGVDLLSVELPAPIDAMGPPYNIEVVFTFADGATAVYQGSFEGDFFNGANHNYVLRFADGLQSEHLAFDGSGWGPAPTTARIVNAGNVITLVLDGSIEPDGIRISTFKSTGTQAPGNVASFSLPAPNVALDPYSPTMISPPPYVPGEVDLTDPANWVDPSVVVVATPAPTVGPTPATDDTEAATTDETDTSDQEAEGTNASDEEAAAVVPPAATGDGGGSNTRDIVLILVGGTAAVGGGTYLWRGRRDRLLPAADPMSAITETGTFAPTYTQTQLDPLPGFGQPPTESLTETDTFAPTYTQTHDYSDLTSTLSPDLDLRPDVDIWAGSGSLGGDHTTTWVTTVHPDTAELSWTPIDAGTALAYSAHLVVDDPASALECDAEDTEETPKVVTENPFPPATGRGSWFRNNRAAELHEQTGEWVDPSTLTLPRLLQRAIDETPEPPTVFTPEMTAASQGMFAGAADAGLRLGGKAMLTDSYDGPTGQPHMFWTVRIGPDGSILHTYENAEKGGEAATAIARLEVYQTDPGVWWAFVKLIDTRTMRIYVANNPHSADPDEPRPRPETPREAMRLALTGLVGDGGFLQPMDPRFSGP